MNARNRWIFATALLLAIGTYFIASVSMNAAVVLEPTFDGEREVPTQSVVP